MRAAFNNITGAGGGNFTGGSLTLTQQLVKLNNQDSGSHNHPEG